jgi:Tol biopolymer transport system component
VAWLVIAVGVLAGCGRIGYEAVAGIDSGADVGAFRPPSLIAEVSDATATDDDPSLTGDMLEMFFNSDRAGGRGGGDIWVSTRATTSDPWSTPTLVAELSSDASETSPEVSADGLAIWFASQRGGGPGGTDVWTSMRADRSSPWTAPVLVAELNSPEEDTSATPGWSSRVMLLETTRPSGIGEADIFVSTRASPSDPWSAPVPLPGINTMEHEGSAHLAPNELTVVLNATRGGNADIHMATRSSIDMPFESSRTVTELNSTENEQDPWLSADGRHIFFVSRRSGSLEIYESTR